MLTALLDGGIAFTLFLQSLGDWLFAPMEFFTVLGTEEFYLLVLPVLYWAVDRRLGLRVGVILLLSSSLNWLLKIPFHMPRPYWYDARVLGLGGGESSFGIPSGHAQNPLSVWGLVASAVRRGWLTAIVAVVVLLIGLSRLVLGVHFYFDVLAGWLIGLLLLWAFLRLEGPVTAWLKRQSFGKQVGAALAVSLALVLTGALVRSSLQDYQVPAEWTANALADVPDEPIAPLGLEGLITSAAALFGFAAGALWLARGKGFSPEGPFWKRTLRFVVGLVGVLALWQGLGAVFPREADLLSYTLRFLRYGLIGSWISALAPILFVRLKLTERAEK